METDIEVSRASRIESLRILLDLLEQNPELPLPLWVSLRDVIVYMWDKDEHVAAAKALTPFRKVYGDEYFDLVRKVGQINYVCRIPRKTSCIATVVGTEKKIKPVCVSEAVWENQEVDVDIVAWDCTGSLRD